jgi:glutamate--cysteine ligase
MPAGDPIRAEELDERILALLLAPRCGPARRQIGIEYERLLLDRSTGDSAPLEFCRELLASLVGPLGAEPTVEDGVLHRIRAPELDLSLEPGGQVEVSLAPCRSLAEVDALLARADAVLDAALAGTPWRLVALGHAPGAPVAALGLLPRRRYRIMDLEMPARGASSRSMMRATAGLQATFDFDDPADASAKLALLNRLVPLLAALAANSRSTEGSDSGFASWRHRIWLDTDTTRSGIASLALEPAAALDDYVRFARRAVVLFVRRNGVLHPAPRAPLADLVAHGTVPITAEDLELHLSSLFPFVRIRGYLELRCFDSVEWPRARALAGLVAALLYCGGARRGAAEVAAQLVPAARSALGELHLAAARDGLAARAPGGASFAELAGELLRLGRDALGMRGCIYAQPADLDPLAARLSGR